ncbi:TIGR03618 family F420-dependent PPOX class oxidoreductase [Streptomyces griseorubiginosus]|uniref:TIGR03618 family F420-dependent PPOX class oxidoreductase n=1 Tax=Streptomyces griseorubiginosus TaxID=67304 RepID=UPI00363075EE
MTTLKDFQTLAASAEGLGVVSTLRVDGGVHASVVNLAVVPHPLDDGSVVAFVTAGKVKLHNLRTRPRLAATARAGWSWATVEGKAEIIGPDDHHPAFDPERTRMLLRQIFVAAGGRHGDWEEYDRVMAKERRAAVLVRPQRVYGVG